MSHPESEWADEEVLEAEVAEEEYEEEEEGRVAARRRFLFFQAAPAWLVSTLVHVLILLVLGLMTFANPVKIINVLTASATAEEGPEIEEFTIDDSEPSEMEEEMEEVTEPVDISEPVEMTEPTAVEMPMDVAMVPLDVSDFAGDLAPPATTLASLSSASSAAPMSSRSSDMKKKLLREYGGTESSEAAVQEALKWFARHQMKRGPAAGGWTLAHNLVCNNQCGNGCKSESRAKQINGATCLALLPFLGAGQTHMEGEFDKVVLRGLQFLIKNGKPGTVNGLPVMDYRGGGNMYDHGLAAIVLCEAYAMTGDPVIAAPAQAALNFIVTAQCRDGGWRYSPRQADGGDTSVVGWQVMALKSGYMGHLAVPPAAIQGSILFLDKVQSKGGSIYGYAAPSTKVRYACTAVGLLCRMYTGWDKEHSGIQDGIANLVKAGPSKGGTNLYGDYYAAQVLRQNGGPEWEKFNNKLRDFLVSEQAAKGDAKGSWHFTDKGHTNEAGRLCQTSLATMILEVYYRHLPLYADAASEDDFPL